MLGPRRSGKEKKIVLTATKPRATEQAQMLSLQERLKKASTVVSFPTIDFRVVKHHVPKAKKQLTRVCYKQVTQLYFAA